MYGFCNNSDEHKREGREDFQRHGRYGYDREKYDDPWNDCNKAYTDGFDDARREADRREEQRQEEEARERRQMRDARERRELQESMEEEFYAQQYAHNVDEEYEKQIQQHIDQHDEPIETEDLPF